MNAPVVLRAARRRAGLTQRQLAERAATTQSAVAAYESGAKEPSMSTLNRLVAATRLSISWGLAPADSPVVVSVQAVGQSVVAGEQAEALRLAADLVSRLAAMTPEQVSRAIAHDPGSTGDQRWDALIAGVVERAAHRAAVRTPIWTAAPHRFLHEWWFLTRYRSLHASALVETPAELANRGVFLHESSLRSV